MPKSFRGRLRCVGLEKSARVAGQIEEPSLPRGLRRPVDREVYEGSLLQGRARQRIVGRAVARDRAVGPAPTNPDHPVFDLTRSEMSPSIVSQSDWRIDAFVASLRATATIIDERIKSEEELSGSRDPSDRCYPMTARAMRERLSYICKTIAKVEASRRQSNLHISPEAR
jgi:hypothetical protein